MQYGKLKYTIYSKKDEDSYSHEWKFSICSENINKAYKRICELIVAYSKKPDESMSYSLYIWDTESCKCEILAQGDVYVEGEE